MSGKPVKQPATKNRPVAVGFVTQALRSFVSVSINLNTGIQESLFALNGPVLCMRPLRSMTRVIVGVFR
jgi:hypothetical protein